MKSFTNKSNQYCLFDCYDRGPPNGGQTKEKVKRLKTEPYRNGIENTEEIQPSDLSPIVSSRKQIESHNITKLIPCLWSDLCPDSRFPHRKSECHTKRTIKTINRFFKECTATATTYHKIFVESINICVF